MKDEFLIVDIKQSSFADFEWQTPVYDYVYYMLENPPIHRWLYFKSQQSSRKTP